MKAKFCIVTKDKTGFQSFHAVSVQICPKTLLFEEEDGTVHKVNYYNVMSIDEVDEEGNVISK